MKKLNLYTIFLISFSVITLLVIVWGVREILILENIKSLKAKTSKLFKTEAVLKETISTISHDNNLLKILSSVNKKEYNSLVSEHFKNKYLIINNFKKILINNTDTVLKEYKETNIAIKKTSTLYSKEYTSIAKKIVDKSQKKLDFDIYFIEKYGLENDSSKTEVKTKLLLEIKSLKNKLQKLYVEINTKLEKAHIKYKTSALFLEKKNTTKINKSQNSIVIFFVFLFLLLFLIFRFLFELVNKPIYKIQDHLSSITKGNLPKSLSEVRTEELNLVVKYINKLVDGLKKLVAFSTEIGKGNFDAKYSLLGEEDALGFSLLSLRDNLILTQEEEKKRKEEDSQRNRTNEGLTLFNEIMRQQSGNINDLADEIISAMVKLIGANQGALFFLNEEDKENVIYELLGAYAYNRKKHIHKHIKPGEGLVGAVVLEKHIVYMTDVPNEYIEIESGTGSANPKSILIVPLKVEDEVLGVIELASFNEIEKYEIDMIEKIADSIASSLANTAINIRIKGRLEKSQDYENQIEIQESEIRKNILELKKLNDTIRDIESLKKENDELKSKISKMSKDENILNL